GGFNSLQPNGGTVYNRNYLARLNADGTLDTSFDAGLNGASVAALNGGYAYGAVLQPDGKLLICGTFTNVQPNGGALYNRGYLVRLNADGTLDTAFDPRPNGVVAKVMPQPDGKVLVSGNFTALQPNGGTVY